MIKLDSQGMARDLKVLTSVNYRIVNHLLDGNPAPCSTQDGSMRNECWIINCIPEFAMDLLYSFSSFSLLILTIIIIHIYIKIFIILYIAARECILRFFLVGINLSFIFYQNVNAEVALREETIKNLHLQSPGFYHLCCFTFISPALRFIRLLQQFPSYIPQWVMLHGRNYVFYFYITFFRNFIILERCSFRKWN